MPKHWILFFYSLGDFNQLTAANLQRRSWWEALQTVVALTQDVCFVCCYTSWSVWAAPLLGLAVTCCGRAAKNSEFVLWAKTQRVKFRLTVERSVSTHTVSCLVGDEWEIKSINLENHNKPMEFSLICGLPCLGHCDCFITPAMKHKTGTAGSCGPNPFFGHKWLIYDFLMTKYQFEQSCWISSDFYITKVWQKSLIWAGSRVDAAYT